MQNPPGNTTKVPPLLASVTGPEALRTLPAEALPALAEDIRRYLVTTVCASGGHLGPSLGVVELTIALHRVFHSPRDSVLFDIGHQAYVHKLLTGRQKGFEQLRRAGGLSGYCCRAESEHDLIENSHASTALSYADGLAKARALAGERDRAVVAVIGDGALTGGMAWEALDNIGAAPERPVIVVLNDNGRSYSPTTGAVATRLAALRAPGPHPAGNDVFAAHGLACLGPVDGHDIPAVEEALRQARALGRPAVVHVVTVKGKGYPFAEADEADCFHAVGVIDPVTGRTRATAAPPVRQPGSWTDVFGQELLALAEQRPDLVAVTAAMLRPTGLHPMAVAHPGRVFDVGIAEQHAVTSAAGLAMGGLHPVVAVYATFLNRAFDQVLMDVALHRLPVTLVLDRAGITGPDGPSHHGMWDISLLALVPGLRVAAPRDTTRLKELLREAVATDDGPTALRLPKAPAGPDLEALARMDGVDVLHRSAGRSLDVLLVSAGLTAGAAVAAARQLEEDEGIGSTVVDPRWITPVNRALVHLAARHHLTVTVEDNTRTGGFGNLLAQACADAAVTTPVRCLGLPRAFLPHGTRADLLADAGLDADGITSAILRAHTDFLTYDVAPLANPVNGRRRP
ncbi:MULTISPECIES: 1-deoxy-D-xylulose-5-phosphate synthase [Streptomyces]|uniref:1-deoxy-D-xylulose-5-phosphate synthase n=1 Tax=Streptomyces TaxID=1883 RepID=UPI00163D0928|nr:MULTISPECIES: 1-deoxy-D-xylulose-5-phosphate synthase [Streptomyces]MBC2878035.1 1-deoxy-D-xylulose-5-phosphate synthase [Streptomyces sp. TYQ1024]UBI39990.1 1-deoxy-D-xylulose-5-phosphate synthase [Streptomyces mobaraensis]UKW32570.1 1-deoxy-D-xylulose-5-phosphate synthase [Streptomyces sp. TYQ1024]